MTADSGYLVADVGGTNARFAIARGSRREGFSIEAVRRFENRDFTDLREVVRTYFEGCGGEPPRRGCIAVAGPVDSSVVRLTNSTWTLDADDLARDLGLEHLRPVNDFAAQARGAPLVSADDLTIVREGRPDRGAPCAVLGPGTGLGLGLLVPRSGDWDVIPTEGGHAGFAPRDDEETAVGRLIATWFGFASWERLLSGAGLVNIHRALCHLSGGAPVEMRPEEITQEALADAGSLSGRAVALFCGVLGAYAGDVAVMSGARGGIFLGGGILPRIRSLLELSAFEERFTEHAPMTGYASAIPVWLILSDAAALLGAAALAEAGEASGS